MFKTRLLSGIVLVAVALLTIISGGYVLFFKHLTPPSHRHIFCLFDYISQ